LGKSSSNIWATFAIFKKLTKVQNHPLGENSPNLVILGRVTWPLNPHFVQAKLKNRLKIVPPAL
jgi:dihydrofolate reductase